MPRESSTRSLLGESTYKIIKETPILVVGAGGIGCELLKNLVLVGFGNIEIIDLDTIDLSNLNRQFLFRKPDISKSKALVAAASARHFNPSPDIKIHARHGNVKDAQNDIEWIKSFGLVLNALDNQDARSHVNRLCQAAKVPLVESGTAGYLGQVAPHINDQTICYNCDPKPSTQKTFPVCTLRATPSEPIHCIVWAKSYLFGKLYGEDDEAGDTEELDKAAADGENADEIANLKQEAAAFREVRQNLGEEDGPRRVFDKVFKADIERLLAMEDLWNKPGRVMPKALDYDAIVDGTFIPLPPRTAPAPAASTQATNGSASTDSAKQGESSATGARDNARLRDQRELSLRDNLELFIDSARRLSARAITHPNDPLSFDKDDDDTLDFVLATSNLRSIAYGIQTKTRFDVKQMASNIIPAIATTNAVIAGFIVMVALRILSGHAQTRGMSFRNNPTRPITFDSSEKPNERCPVCRDTYIVFKVDADKFTLGEFVQKVVKGWLEPLVPALDGEDDAAEVDWVIREGARGLADPDFEDNYERTFSDLEVGRGKMITVQDEEGKLRPIHFCISEPDPNQTEAFTLPYTLPRITHMPAPIAETKAESDPDIEQLEIHDVPQQVLDAAAEREKAGVKRKRAPGPVGGDTGLNGQGGVAGVAENGNGNGEGGGGGEGESEDSAGGAKKRKVDEVEVIELDD